MGVHWSKARHRWMAKIVRNKKVVFYHAFMSREAAVAAETRFLIGENFEPPERRVGRPRRTKTLHGNIQLLDEEFLHEEEFLTPEEL